MTQGPIGPPPGWGHDKLSQFIDGARHNQYATFANKRLAYRLMQEVDECMHRAGSNLLNPKDGLTPVFLYRCHSAFRAAAGLAMGGQLVETYPLLRSCLESAAYALFIDKTPGMAKVWLDRNESATAKNQMKNEFQVSKVRAVIHQSDKRLAEVFQHLYELCIDLGGHPNQLGVMGSLQIREGEDRTEFLQIYLHGDGVVLDAALKMLVDVGICCLFVFLHNDTFKHRFELLGVTERVKALRREVGKLSKKAALHPRSIGATRQPERTKAL